MYDERIAESINFSGTRLLREAIAKTACGCFLAIDYNEKTGMRQSGGIVAIGDATGAIAYTIAYNTSTRAVTGRVRFETTPVYYNYFVLTGPVDEAGAAVIVRECFSTEQLKREKATPVIVQDEELYRKVVEKMEVAARKFNAAVVDKINDYNIGMSEITYESVFPTKENN